jgi:hypothetical protein
MLQDKSRVLSFLESGRFFDSMYRVNNSYDQSVYNSLFQSTKNFSLEVLNRHIYLQDPCLNMCLSGQFEDFIHTLDLEISQRKDGLMNSFLLNMPQPVFLKAKDLREAINHETISLTSIFYMLFKIHEADEKREYIFENIYKIDCLHDYFKYIIKRTHKLDQVIR